jgi:hypothetical protein
LLTPVSHLQLHGVSKAFSACAAFRILKASVDIALRNINHFAMIAAAP